MQLQMQDLLQKHKLPAQGWASHTDRIPRESCEKANLAWNQLSRNQSGPREVRVLWGVRLKSKPHFMKVSLLVDQCDALGDAWPGCAFREGLGFPAAGTARRGQPLRGMNAPLQSPMVWGHALPRPLMSRDRLYQRDKSQTVWVQVGQLSALLGSQPSSPPVLLHSSASLSAQSCFLSWPWAVSQQASCMLNSVSESTSRRNWPTAPRRPLDSHRLWNWDFRQIITVSFDVYNYEVDILLSPISQVVKLRHREVISLNCCDPVRNQEAIIWC